MLIQVSHICKYVRFSTLGKASKDTLQEKFKKLVEKAWNENPHFQSSVSTKFDKYCEFITLKLFDKYCGFITLKLFPFSNLLMQTKRMTFN